MDFNAYFSPVDRGSLGINSTLIEQESQLLFNQVFFFDHQEELDFTNIKIVIVGVPESRNSYENLSCSLAPDEIRRQFYKLYTWANPMGVMDLGNLKVGNTIKDTYEALSEVVAYFVDLKIIPIILGGSNDLAYGCYMGYEKLERVVNIVSVDACLDMGNENMPLKSNAYLNKIVMRQPNYLLNYANIGYQTYMNSQETLELMKKLFFETYRVGLIRQNMEEVEPIVRNAEMLSLDVSAIRRPDAPGNPHGSSNGFYGEEICQVTRYGGLSDNLSSFGVYEYDPTIDYNNQTSQLLAQAIWYFVEGVTLRQDDISFKNKNNYVKHSVSVSENEKELIFYRSKKTGRWWIVVPVINKNDVLDQKYFLPCSQADYKTACQDRIPERWWAAFYKLNK